MSSSGYDTPIETANEDMLHRLGFAREIVDLAISAPKRWPIRIGLYGPWGTGKSSVLNLCRRLIESRNHVTADFSPWGHGSAKEMLQGLAAAAIDALAAKGLAVEGGAGRKLIGAADSIGKATDAALGVAEYVPGLETVAKIGSHGTRLAGPWLLRLLERQADSFAAIDRALGSRRLVVLIDDVDRADPGILPQLLFALHEVMAQPGISYIAALDPAVVGSALANYHPGFGSGLSFLEKVIQFPRWIPEPSRDDLAALAQREARDFAPFIPSNVIRDNLDLLPVSPRGLKGVLRNLWTIGQQAQRHDQDEFDPHLLLRVHLLRSEFPKLFREVAVNTDKLIGLVASGSRQSDKGDAAREEKILEAVTPCVAEDQRERAAKLLRALVSNGMLWNTERVMYYALMVEAPHAVTWKEFRSFIAEFVAQPTGVTIKRLLAAHAKTQETTEQRVAEEIFVTAARYHRVQMERAADSSEENGQGEPIALAISAIELMDKLVFECCEQCPLTSERFKVLLGAFRSWAHFSSAIYRDIRNRERLLLMKCVSTTAEPQALMGILAPWKSSGYFDERQRVLTNDLVEALVPRIAASLEDVFLSPSGIGAAIDSDCVANRWVLFHPLRFWTAERIKSISNVIVRTSLLATVAENCSLFLQKLVDDRMESGRWGIDRRAVDEILRNTELVAALWRGTCAKAVNVRYFSAFREFRHRLEEKIGCKLEDPVWWERVDAELVRVNAQGVADADDRQSS